jgi:hypothetical protein
MIPFILHQNYALIKLAQSCSLPLRHVPDEVIPGKSEETRFLFPWHKVWSEHANKFVWPTRLNFKSWTKTIIAMLFSYGLPAGNEII